MVNKKLIVLDDDPTGIQTVHDVLVVCNPTEKNIKDAFLASEQMFYILTNSRAFTQDQTISYHRDLISKIVKISNDTGIPYMILSRSDSTLRGHYYLETETIKEEIEKSGIQVDGEIFVPYLAGIRSTENDVHYVIHEGCKTPASQTDYAKDKTFGYKNSNLRDYIEEKSYGKYKAKDCISITLEELKNNQKDSISQKLQNAKNYQKIIVNATCMDDIQFFVEVFEAINHKNFIFRCAASIVKALGHVETIDFLNADKLENDGKGGCIIVGSHVSKTTLQLEYLKENNKKIHWIEFNQHKIIDGTLHEESERVANELNKILKMNEVAVVATKRERVDFPGGDEDKQIEWATEISRELMEVVRSIKQRPKFMITKGGITSSDTLTIGLSVEKEWVLGQIAPLIGVVRCLEGSKFEGLPVVIFPGNVGEVSTLHDVLTMLMPRLDG